MVEDDYDSEFRYDTRPIPSLQGLDQAGRVIYVSTFSKSMAPSMRIGYMVLPVPVLEMYRAEYGVLFLHGVAVRAADAVPALWRKGISRGI